jgi:aspartate dehydrogenase
VVLTALLHALRPDVHRRSSFLSEFGIGPYRTRLEIWADPTLERNCHWIEVESDSARFSMQIENIPSENPKTGRITAQSVIAYLRKLHAPLRVGT